MKGRTRWGFLTAIVCLAIVLSGCAAKCGSHKEEVLMWTATDLHYLSPRLTDKGEAFMSLVENGDGKVVQYIEEITDAFLAEVVKQKPEVLILTGDLTFNGEYESHADLAAKLKKVSEAGVQVLAIPGNHDLNNPQAASFSGVTWERGRSLSAAEFEELYRDFGLEQAVSRDAASLSYIYELRPDLRILMLDTNSAAANVVQEETFAWVEEQLKAAEKDHVKVIAASHQNLLAHNSMFTVGFRIYNAAALLELYEQYGVLCNLSGHIHLQDIRKDAVSEMATSSLAVSPNQYGVILFDGKTLSYETRPVDVTSWAKRQGTSDANLKDFEAYSRGFFLETARNQVLSAVEKLGLSAKDKNLLADTFAGLNAAYFAGDAINRQELEEGIALWGEQLETFLGSYIQSILQEDLTESHRLVLEIE